MFRYDFIPAGTLRRSGYPMTVNKPRFGVAHDTGNLNSTAAGNVSYFKGTANMMQASAHVFVDDKEAVVCIPMNEKAWHVLYNRPLDNELYGDDANDVALGVELCYFEDKNRSLQAYDRYVEVWAELCHLFGWDPMKDIIGHDVLDPQRKTDPTNALRRLGKTTYDFTSEVRERMRSYWLTQSQRDGIEAVHKLHKLNRVSSPEEWIGKIESGNVPNLEWLFIKWLDDAERGFG